MPTDGVWHFTDIEVGRKRPSTVTEGGTAQAAPSVVTGGGGVSQAKPSVMGGGTSQVQLVGGSAARPLSPVQLGGGSSSRALSPTQLGGGSSSRALSPGQLGGGSSSRALSPPVILKGSLSFDLFLDVQSPRIRELFTRSEIRTWFDAADTNHSGMLEFDEFFTWSMSAEAHELGSTSLEVAFRHYDKDLTGKLSAEEFKAAATEMGFGQHALGIFRRLDADRSHVISYQELCASLAKQVPGDEATRGMLITMMWSFNKTAAAEALADAIDTSKWVIRGRDAESVRAEFHTLLVESGADVHNIMRLFDDDANSSRNIDVVEFHKSMRAHLGFRGNAIVLDEVFASIATGGRRGGIGYDEMYEFVRGHRHAGDKRALRADNRLVLPEGVPMEEVGWNIEVLRHLIKQMLTRCELSAEEVLSSWVRGRARSAGTSRSPTASAQALLGVASPRLRVRMRGGFKTDMAARFGATCDRSGRRGLSTRLSVKDAHRPAAGRARRAVAERTVWCLQRHVRRAARLGQGRELFR